MSDTDILNKIENMIKGLNESNSDSTLKETSKLTGELVGTYILKDREPISCKDVLEWARWQETFDNTLFKTEINNYSISTIFLGTAYGMSNFNKPILFETMAFDANGDSIDVERYFTYQQAEIGHEIMVNKYK